MTLPVNTASSVATSDSRYVAPEEFLEYALARTRWERTSDPDLGLTGLTCPDANDSVVVDSAELDRFRLLPR
ncbi:MAG: hypothetical protein JNG89_14530 [Planctomycetaceae bacterium]|nr:hypothetical protein [Planctomycetaceae bacterium]